MSDRIIIADMPDETVATIVPIPGDTPEGLIESGNLPRCGREARNLKIVDKSILNGMDKYFRNAWKVEGDGVAVDMAKARDIHMSRVRKSRDKALSGLDLDYLKADEDGDSVRKAEVAAKKKALRDLPTTFDLSGFSVPAELKAAWPSELPEEDRP